jgi:hypothetical protein
MVYIIRLNRYNFRKADKRHCFIFKITSGIIERHSSIALNEKNEII